jgi:hypothetical protein
MRWGVLIALVCGLLAPSGAASGARASRAACNAACGVLVAQCATTCGVFATMNTACRRAILKRCQREGMAVCTPPTTSTTSTTAVASTTLPTTTTTTHGPTTSTTIPSGLGCGLPRPLTIGTSVSGDTGIGSDHGPGVACMQNAAAPDLVYVIVPPADGTLVLALTSQWDGGLYVRTTCDDPETELACQDVLGDNATEVLELGVKAGATYYVYVDGYTTESFGPYELASELR